MKKKVLTYLECLLVFASLISLYSCSQINGYLGLKDDNVYEEIIEAAIKIETGIDIDLTPESKE